MVSHLLCVCVVIVDLKVWMLERRGRVHMEIYET